MHIDPRSHVPVYLQIVEGIRAAVAAGVHRAGEGLPSTRALAVQLHVNPNTVQRAYETLEREGLVESRRGLGMFVARKGAASAQSQTDRAILRLLRDAVARCRAAGMDESAVAALIQRALDESTRRVS